MSAIMRTTQVGRFQVTALRDARFALDGGAMFGVVPRVLWEQLTPVNDDHTIPLSTTPFLVQDGTCTIVIEPGLGRRWPDKQRAMFHIDSSGGHDLLDSLHAVGVAPEEVTHCLMTHCHWDHIGAACGEDGTPIFPSAEYWTPQSERDACMNPDHLRRASYRREDLAPVEEGGQLYTFAGEGEVLPGVRMVEVGGHSDGVSLVILEDNGQAACFWADVVPTRNHVNLPFIMAYDMNAEKSFEVRSEWIARAADEGWTCLLYHDPDEPIGRFVGDGRKYAWEALSSA
ncbi:MAG: MBL fold metallo-hydrolase [Planctomycetes bacterium]|nr:MBL fold metallo-hydrolase [Planctomycetota bacterium]